jgi:hypothetical protein
MLVRIAVDDVEKENDFDPFNRNAFDPVKLD